MLETRGRVGGKIFICDKKNRRFFFSQIKILINFFLEHSVLGKKIYEKIFFSSTPCSGKIFFRKSFYKFFLFAKQIKKIYKKLLRVCCTPKKKKIYQRISSGHVFGYEVLGGWWLGRPWSASTAAAAAVSAFRAWGPRGPAGGAHAIRSAAAHALLTARAARR